jgi:hypothetical protein
LILQKTFEGAVGAFRDGDRKCSGVSRDDKRDWKWILHIVTTKRRLEGIWANGLLKCGSYSDEQENQTYVQPTDLTGITDGMIPIIQRKDPDGLLAEVDVRKIDSRSFLSHEKAPKPLLLSDFWEVRNDLRIGWRRMRDSFAGAVSE